MKRSPKLLIKSTLALLLCFTMLLGTTYAWFTDSAKTGVNIIKSGTLDIEMYWTDDLENGTWNDIEDEKTNTVFDYNKWEPGYAEVRYVKIVNAGNLAFKYSMTMLPIGDAGTLAEVIDVYFVENASENIEERTDLTDSMKIGTLDDVIKSKVGANGVLLPKNETKPGFISGELVVAVALKMQESAGNEYQNASVGSGFTIQLLATQFTHESDSFGDNYDSEALFPEIEYPQSGKAEVETTEDNKVKNQVSIDTGVIKATIPAGVKLDAGTTSVTLSIQALSDTASNIKTNDSELMCPLDVHISGIADDNNVPMLVSLGEIMPKGMNMGAFSLYHVEEGVTNTMTQIALTDDFTAHNQFKYDPLTGEITISVASFSEITLLANTENPWTGNFDYTWYNAEETEFTIASADQLAAFGAIVGGMNSQTQDSFEGKTVTLVTDINLGDKESENKEDLLFYPIGYYYTDDKNADGTTGDYYSALYSFEGTFNGNGNCIYNFYQNTWEMKGDYEGNYYSDGMGLFGYIANGTVKNLTVDNFSSDGEFTPTGVIAAYAVNSTFENIAITNCNPRVYNTGNGGIVGIGGNNDDPDTYKLTFTNITVDITNKITSLWGSWDTACGGLVGMFRGDGHVYMTNCNVAAQIDVFNDVCGNYQYYWYRYSGMMVGTNKNMTTDDKGYTVPETDKYHATNCTVHFGNWNDYYYCELVANSLASYTHDHQFSRLTQIESLGEIKDGENWTKAGNFLLIEGDTKTCYHIVNKDGALTQHNHIDSGYEDDIDEDGDGYNDLKEDKQIVYLPFNQLFTGYGWGVKHIPVYNGNDYAFEGIRVLDREIADSVEKFVVNENYYPITDATIESITDDVQYPISDFFSAKDSAEININTSGVWVTIQKVDKNSDVRGTYTKSASDNWEYGHITFTGSGLVRIIIQDYDYCIPTVLTILVEDAKEVYTGIWKP